MALTAEREAYLRLAAHSRSDCSAFQHSFKAYGGYVVSVVMPILSILIEQKGAIQHEWPGEIMTCLVQRVFELMKQDIEKCIERPKPTVATW